MKETRLRQFCCARSAAYRVPRFQDTNGMAGAGNFYGCRKAVRARADNDGIEFHRIIVYTGPAPPAARANQQGITDMPLLPSVSFRLRSAPERAQRSAIANLSGIQDVS